MKIIVQKYGGTSVNTAKSRSMIIKNMIDAIDDGFKPIIVVSAMGRKPEPYATDSLLGLLPDTKTASKRRNKSKGNKCKSAYRWTSRYCNKWKLRGW